MTSIKQFEMAQNLRIKAKITVQISGRFSKDTQESGPERCPEDNATLLDFVIF
jgi:hypothetical protein